MRTINPDPSITAPPRSRSAAREELEALVLEREQIDAALADRHRTLGGRRQPPNEYFAWRANILKRKSLVASRHRFLKGWLEENSQPGGPRLQLLEQLATAVGQFLGDQDDTDETYQALVDAYDAWEQGAA